MHKEEHTITATVLSGVRTSIVNIKAEDAFAIAEALIEDGAVELEIVDTEDLIITGIVIHGEGHFTPIRVDHTLLTSEELN